MQRRSQDLALLIATALLDRHLLCALHILTTVIQGLMDADGPPHPLLKHVSVSRIDFQAILDEGNLVEEQRLVVIVSAFLFEASLRDGPDSVCIGDLAQGPDHVNNNEAVIDGMDVQADLDPGYLIRSRIVSRLCGFLVEWTRAGL